jgi:membrane protein implicated in regulation of membrane protease activity
MGIVIEAVTQDLVSIWFSVGGLVSMILSGFEFIPWYIETIVFVVVSLTAVICTRPLAKKLLSNALRSTNIDEYVGKQVKVLKDISKFENGEVRFNDVIYSACLMEEETDPIKEGEIVEVVTFRGNKIVVKKIEE